MGKAPLALPLSRIPGKKFESFLVFRVRAKSELGDLQPYLARPFDSRRIVSTRGTCGKRTQRN